MVATTTLLYLGLFLICAAVVVVVGRKVLAAPKPGEAAAGPAPAHSPWIAMAVVDAQGDALGEVVRIQGEEVVVKHGGMFLVVPRPALTEQGGKLRAGDFDRAEATARGEAWRKQQENVMKYDAQGMPVPER